MTTDNTNLLLLGVLAINALVLILVIVIAARSSKSSAPAKTVKPTVGLSAVEKEKLEQASHQKMEAAVDQMTTSLQKEFESFSKDLKNVLTNNATSVLSTQLDQAKQLIGSTVENMNLTLATASNEAAGQLKTEVAQQKQKLIEQFELHMADIINSYLVTALGVESAQSDQVAQALKQLEAHKEDLRKDLSNEA